MKFLAFFLLVVALLGIGAVNPLPANDAQQVLPAESIHSIVPADFNDTAAVRPPPLNVSGGVSGPVNLDEINDLFKLSNPDSICKAFVNPQISNAACTLYCFIQLKFKGGYCNVDKKCICK